MFYFITRNLNYRWNKIISYLPTLRSVWSPRLRVSIDLRDSLISKQLCSSKRPHLFYTIVTSSVARCQQVARAGCTPRGRSVHAVHPWTIDEFSSTATCLFFRSSPNGHHPKRLLVNCWHTFSQCWFIHSL